MRPAIAIIWKVVFHLPIRLTATTVTFPILAIHSRRAVMAISRPMMVIAGMAIIQVCPLKIPELQKCSTMRTSAVVTVSLSATGSRNAPNLEQRLYFLAI